MSCGLKWQASLQGVYRTFSRISSALSEAVGPRLTEEERRDGAGVRRTNECDESGGGRELDEALARPCPKHNSCEDIVR